MTGAAGPRRQAALIGVVGVVCLLGVLAVWLTSPDSARHAAFGSGGSIVVLVVALAGTAAGVLATGGWRSLRVRRWLVALPLAVVAGLVTVLAVTAVFVPHSGTDVALGMLLVAAAIAMDMVAVRVSRN